MDMLFKDRHEAGVRLAQRLKGEGFQNPVVLALPRGGVPVAAPVAAVLGVPVVPFVARKIGAPGHPELGVGAVAEGTDEVVVSDVAAQLGLSEAELKTMAEDERPELDRRVDAYRGGSPLPSMEGRDVVLIDDGLATGVTAEAALRAIRRHRPRRLVLAEPVCARDSAQRLAAVADELICLASPEAFHAVGTWYETFEETTDEEVLSLLAPPAEGLGFDPDAGSKREVSLAVSRDAVIHGDLTVPPDAGGLVMFAHGSGSSRRSPRNRSVASTLQERRLATMLIDLLTDAEQREDAETGKLRFDVDLLTERVSLLTDWLGNEPSTAELPLGYFGASTGAAAALVAAARVGDRVRAVVSRGGRCDLAGEALGDVSAPTLLIVGGHDEVVLELNRRCCAVLGKRARLEVVEGATHLFEEEGALEQVARLAGDWFTTHLPDR